MSENCDLKERQKDLNKNGKRLYGKRMLESHKPYKLWNEETDEFDLEMISIIYKMFRANMRCLSEDFIPRWVEPEELLVATKQLIWDWTNEEELHKTAESIKKHGVYFPIFVLPRGILHNQICSEEEMDRLKSLNLYNSYNGNHRIDAIQFLKKNNEFDKKVLVYEIPPYCQKSCTGFKYTPIDGKIPCELTSYKLSSDKPLFNLQYLEDEMKMSNLIDIGYCIKGINMVAVNDFNTAFRIVTAMQNALEPPLTRYFELYGKLPDVIKNAFFNDIKVWEKEMYNLNDNIRKSNTNR